MQLGLVELEEGRRLDPESLEREARGKEGGPRTVLVVGRWLILVLSQGSFLRKEMEVMQEKLLRWGGGYGEMMRVGVGHIFRYSAL